MMKDYNHLTAIKFKIVWVLLLKLLQSSLFSDLAVDNCSDQCTLSCMQKCNATDICSSGCTYYNMQAGNCQVKCTVTCLTTVRMPTAVQDLHMQTCSQRLVIQSAQRSAYTNPLVSAQMAAPITIWQQAVSCGLCTGGMLPGLFFGLLQSWLLLHGFEQGDLRQFLHQFLFEPVQY